MTVPAALLELKKRVYALVEEFFAENNPADSCLILDSTGPGLTKHYILMQAIGVDRLLQLKKIHAFSGGAFAYFGFLALTGGYTNYRLDEFATSENEAGMRRCHHVDRWGGVRALSGLVFQRSAFGSSAPMRRTLDYYFDKAYLDRMLGSFSPQLSVHLGVRGYDDPVEVSIDDAATLERLGAVSLLHSPVRDLVTAATTVPFVYGRADRSDQYFDPVYTTGYAKALKNASAGGMPTLVSTPWKQGKKNNITFVNCFSGRHPKWAMLSDFARLILNVPNRTYGHEITAAFLLSNRVNIC